MTQDSKWPIRQIWNELLQDINLRSVECLYESCRSESQGLRRQMSELPSKSNSTIHSVLDLVRVWRDWLYQLVSVMIKTRWGDNILSLLR